MKCRERIFNRLYLWYYFVDGMPVAVSTYLPKQNLFAVRRVQRWLILGYEQDFSMHAPTVVIPRTALRFRVPHL